MIAKGIDRFPDNTDRMAGSVDVWWIVHDGGMLMLLPFLLTQNKVWRHCKMRIFTVAQMEDNSIQMKKDVEKFVYQLRIHAEVQVIEMRTADISAYTYERTLVMEQRSAMLRAAKEGGNGMSLTPQKLVDSAGDTPPTVTELKVDSGIRIEVSPGDVELSAVLPQSADVENGFDDSPSLRSTNSSLAGSRISLELTNNQYSFSANSGQQLLKQDLLLVTKPNKRNVRRMHTAVRLNETIRSKSQDARLVILNLPGPPKNEAGEENYMGFLEVLAEGMERVLMVRGGGREVITIYS
jgi:potassium/chloride transporter 4/5/6